MTTLNDLDHHMSEGDFVCAGCGEIFFETIATRCSLADADGGRDKQFHSPECTIAWSERQS